jgi:phosphate/sulfate permease
MSRKKKKDNATQGNYALCITLGLVLGFGLGISFEQILLSSVVGAAAGAAVARRLQG